MKNKKGFIVVAIILLCFIIVYPFMGSDLYTDVAILFINKKNKDKLRERSESADKNESDYFEKVKIDYTGFDFSPEGNRDSPDYEPNRAGLNFILISKLNNSYIKELLSLYHESSEGLICSNTVRLSVPGLLGLQVVESGFYPNTKIPKSYLPIVNGAVLWNVSSGGVDAESLTLRNYDKTIASMGIKYEGIDTYRTSGINTVSVFQYDTWDSRGVVSKYSNTINKNRSKADHYFLPDVLATNNKYIQDFLTNDLKLTNLGTMNEDMLTGIYGGIHNRGEAGYLRYSVGGTFNKKVSFDYKNISDEERLYIAEGLVMLPIKYKKEPSNADNLAKINIDASVFRKVFLLLALEDPDWYITKTASNYAKGSLKSYNDLYNTLFPDKAKDANAFIALLDQKTKSYTSALHDKGFTSVSDSDVLNIYGTTSGEYSSWSWGNAFTVTNKTSTGYSYKMPDGSSPPLIQGCDIVCGGEIVAGVLFGDLIYANLLLLGGLTDVDPSNPETYRNTFSADDFVPPRN